MSTVNLTNKTVKGRKEYSDQAQDHFGFMIMRDENANRVVDQKEADYLKMTAEDVAVIQACIDRKWRIPVGEVHRHQSGLYENDFYDVRISEPIYQIMVKYDLFSDD